MNICSRKQIVSLPFWWHVHHLDNNVHIQHQELEDNTQHLALLIWQIPITTSSLITYKKRKTKMQSKQSTKAFSPSPSIAKKLLFFGFQRLMWLCFIHLGFHQPKFCVTKGLCCINGRVFQLTKESFMQGGVFKIQR